MPPAGPPPPATSWVAARRRAALGVVRCVRPAACRHCPRSTTAPGATATPTHTDQGQPPLLTSETFATALVAALRADLGYDFVMTVTSSDKTEVTTGSVHLGAGGTDFATSTDLPDGAIEIRRIGGQLYLRSGEATRNLFVPLGAGIPDIMSADQAEQLVPLSVLGE